VQQIYIILFGLGCFFCVYSSHCPLPVTIIPPDSRTARILSRTLFWMALVCILQLSLDTLLHTPYPCRATHTHYTTLPHARAQHRHRYARTADRNAVLRRSHTTGTSILVSTKRCCDVGAACCPFAPPPHAFALAALRILMACSWDGILGSS